MPTNDKTNRQSSPPGKDRSRQSVPPGKDRRRQSSPAENGRRRQSSAENGRKRQSSPAENDRRRKSSTLRKRRRRRRGININWNFEMIRNILLLVLLFTVLVLFFVFGVNKWRISIKLNGAPSVTWECEVPYEDEGAEAEASGSILSFIHHPLQVDTDDRVNIHEPGTYTVTYTAKFLWHTAKETRRVNIVDTTPPVLELNHIEDYYTLPHHAYEEEGFTATDTHDGDITGRVKNEEIDGVVYYSVSDAAGNTTTAEREIFYDDRNAPVFRFPQGEEAFLYQGGKWKDDVRAEDDADGDVTKKVRVSGTVDTTKIGTYTLTYTVTDEWGNTATKNRYVTVKRPAPVAPETMDPQKVIYLTFDDGPGEYTEELLKILEKHKVLATFFVTAAFEDYQDLIGAEYNAGHSVAVHTATHDYSEIYESTDAYWSDFNKMQRIILQQTGCRTDLFRFPGGSSNTISANYCEGIMTELAKESGEKGYIYVDWNVTSGDAGDTTDGEVMYENMMEGIHKYENSFILCHDIKDYTVAMMDRFITDALAEGYTFLPITSETRTCHHGINN